MQAALQTASVSQPYFSVRVTQQPILAPQTAPNMQATQYPALGPKQAPHVQATQQLALAPQPQQQFPQPVWRRQ